MNYGFLFMCFLMVLEVDYLKKKVFVLLRFVSSFSSVPSDFPRDVFGMLKAGLSDGKNNHGQTHIPQNVLLLQTVQEKIKVR